MSGFLQRTACVLVYTLAMLALPNIIEARVAPESARLNPNEAPHDLYRAPECPRFNAAGERLRWSVAERPDNRAYWTFECRYGS